MEEPSVLDYLKSRLFFWRNTTIEIPDVRSENANNTGDAVMLADADVESGQQSAAVGLRGMFSSVLSFLPAAIVLIGIVAQSGLESEDRHPLMAAILYGAAGVLLIWRIVTGKWRLPALSGHDADRLPSEAFRKKPAIAALILLPFSFLLFNGNRFTQVNLLTWLALILLFLIAFWEEPRDGWQGTWRTVRDFFNNPALSFRITPWTMLVLICTGLVVYFRLHSLAEVPGEMFSDHAEKLLDVAGVMNGEPLIFFPRNTGREAVQMYLTAAVGAATGTGLSFMSLKLGTALAGLLAMPFIYLIGKQIGGKWVGLAAFVLGGIAYWPNVISRIGLRFPLYPLFAAPAIYFLIKGLQNRSRNDLLAAGVMIGLGMHGYSPFRIMPLIVLIAFTIYFAFCRSEDEKSRLGMSFLVLTLAAIIIFLPLMKYMTEDPVNFGERAFSRLVSIERPLPGEPLQILFSNFWKTLVMPFWDNGNIWVHSVVGRPALDVVSAVFFFMGSIVLAARFFRNHHWTDLFLILSIPVLMLPSILSLAFPEENPSLNRTAGAIVPVFVFTAFGLVSFIQTLAGSIRGRRGKAAAALAALILLMMTIQQNYDLVFNQFKRQFDASALNTSEIGMVIKAFDEMGGSPDSAFVVPFPYWVDTRLVGINAGFPSRDFALIPENFASTREDPRMKLFILKPEDQTNLAAIERMYPDGILSTFSASIQGKDFLMYQVPPDQ